MKNYLSLILILIPFNALSQEKQIEVPVLSKNQILKYAHRVPGKGILFHFEEEDPNVTKPAMKSEPQILMVTEDLELIKNIQLERYEKKKQVGFMIPANSASGYKERGCLLSSANSSAVYYVYFYEDFKKFRAKKINWDGSTEDIAIDDFNKKVRLNNFNPTPEVMFIDSNRLYIMQRYRQEKKSVTYFCTIDLKTLEVKDKILSLPDIEINYDAALFGWRYMGHGNGKIYMKYMEVPEDKMQDNIPFRVLTIDYDGKVLSEVKYNLNVAPKFTYLSYNYQDYNNVEFRYANTVEDKGPLDMGSMKISYDKKFVYLYGTYRDQQGAGKYRKGFFVGKYSMTGETIWQNNHAFSEEVLKDKKLTLHATRYSLNYSFDDNEVNGKLSMHIWGGKQMYHYILDAEKGALEKSLITEDYQTFNYYNDYHHSTLGEQVVINSVDYDQKAYEFARENRLDVKRAGASFYMFRYFEDDKLFKIWKF